MFHKFRGVGLPSWERKHTLQTLATCWAVTSVPRGDKTGMFYFKFIRIIAPNTMHKNNAQKEVKFLFYFLQTKYYKFWHDPSKKTERIYFQIGWSRCPGNALPITRLYLVMCVLMLHHVPEATNIQIRYRYHWLCDKGQLLFPEINICYISSGCQMFVYKDASENLMYWLFGFLWKHPHTCHECWWRIRKALQSKDRGQHLCEDVWVTAVTTTLARQSSGMSWSSLSPYVLLRFIWRTGTYLKTMR